MTLPFLARSALPPDGGRVEAVTGQLVAWRLVTGMYTWTGRAVPGSALHTTQHYVRH